jgi:hypothetical protein
LRRSMSAYGGNQTGVDGSRLSAYGPQADMAGAEIP